MEEKKWSDHSPEERGKMYHDRWRSFNSQCPKQLTEDEIESILSTLAMTVNDLAFRIGAKLIGHIAYLEQELKSRDALRTLAIEAEELDL